MHRLLARTRFGLFVAIKTRNQANAVIRAALSDGTKPGTNGELWLLMRIGPDLRIFIDVGANVGSWSRTCFEHTSHACRGLLFEPSPQAIHALRLNLKQWGLQNRTEVVAKAASDQPGLQQFSAEPLAGETSSLVMSHSRPDSNSISVEVTTIDEELQARGIHAVDLLKVDAEGYDLRVLKGAARLLRARSIQVIQFEYNAPWVHAGSTLADAIAFLSGFGYEVRLLTRTGTREFSYETYGDFYGYANFVAFFPEDKRFE